MTFITPTIPADANPGPLVYAELETALLGVGYTLEDTVVIGARTHKVLKSAAAGNTRGLDWYLDVSYPTTGIASGVLLAPFEGYDPATDLGLRGPYSNASATVDATTFSRYGATGQALETNWVNTASYSSVDTPLATSSFGVWASVTRDRVILMASTEPTQVSYTGFFTPSAQHITHASDALYPLIMTRLSGFNDRSSTSTASAVTACLTRVPRRAGINWYQSVVFGPDFRRMGGVVGGIASSVTGVVSCSPFTVGIGYDSWGGPNGYVLAPVGELDGVRCAWGDAAVVRGDTVTVDGDPFVTSSVLSNACLLFEAV
jgi:hypothetical protein